MTSTEDSDRRDDGTTRREDDAWWLRALFDNALDAILIADDTGRYVDANPAACALLGYSHAELLRLSVWELTPASVREQAETLWREFGASGQQSGKFVLQRQDGALVEVEHRAVADFLPGLHLSILRDITERKQSERLLIESKNELQQIYDSVPVMICQLNPDRKVMEANEYFRAFTGWPDEPISLSDKACGVLGCINSLEDPRGCGFGSNCKKCALRLAILDTLKTGCSHTGIEYQTTLLVDGVKKDITALCSTAFIEKNHQRRILLSLIDITDRKQTETHLTKTTARLRQLSRRLLSVQEEERRALARELHDDLGQQLVVLKLNLAMLERDLRGSAYQDRLIDCIHLAEQGRESIKETIRRLRPALLDDLGLAEALHWYARSETERTGCAIEVRDRLPALLSPDLETAVFRIAQEAVNNAIRHGSARRIDLAVAVDAGELTLAVQDDGVGFDPDALSNNPASASGLGLIGMRERAELLDGRFALVSRPGAGARIDVTIPMPRTPP